MNRKCHKTIRSANVRLGKRKKNLRLVLSDRVEEKKLSYNSLNKKTLAHYMITNVQFFRHKTQKKTMVFSSLKNKEVDSFNENE